MTARLSIVGRSCSHCGEAMGESLFCPYCGHQANALPWWVDLALLLEASTFEADYAKRSGITVHQLHVYGRFAEPCDCDFTGCTGWQMGHQWKDAIVEDIGR